MEDRRRLKREFGPSITLWGGFDQQQMLPLGTPEQVREETRRLLDDFMPGGGFMLAAGHISRPVCRLRLCWRDLRPW